MEWNITHELVIYKGITDGLPTDYVRISNVDLYRRINDRKLPTDYRSYFNHRCSEANASVIFTDGPPTEFTDGLPKLFHPSLFRSKSVGEFWREKRAGMGAKFSDGLPTEVLSLIIPSAIRRQINAIFKNSSFRHKSVGDPSVICVGKTGISSSVCI